MSTICYKVVVTREYLQEFSTVSQQIPLRYPYYSSNMRHPENILSYAFNVTTYSKTPIFVFLSKEHAFSFVEGRAHGPVGKNKYKVLEGYTRNTSDPTTRYSAPFSIWQQRKTIPSQTTLLTRQTIQEFWHLTGDALRKFGFTHMMGLVEEHWYGCYNFTSLREVQP